MRRFFQKYTSMVLTAAVMLFPSAVHGWDLSTASYDSISFSINAQAPTSYALALSDDGTKMYIGGHATQAIFQYTLSTPWDVSTASYDTVSLDVSSQDAQPSALFFKPDGTKMFMLGSSNDDVFQYTLSTPWDLSTASYDSVNFDATSVDPAQAGLYFRSDGLKMYTIGYSGDDVYQYTLSTAWDLSTASYDSVSFDVSSQDTTPFGFSMHEDGTQMYVLGFGCQCLYQYTLSTPWDVSTASYDTVSFSIGGQDTYPTAVFFRPNGAQFYLLGRSSDSVHRYSMTDVYNPELYSLSPTDDSTGVAPESNLVMTFDEEVDVETGNISIFTSDDTLVESIDVTSGQVTGTGTSTITINPSSDLAEGTLHYVQVDATAFDDSVSNSFPGISDSTTWSFTTSDVSNPLALSLSPTDGASNVAVTANLVITFDEAVDVESGNITIFTSDNTLVEAIDVTGGQVTGTGTNIITINPSANFSEGTSYYVQVEAPAFDDSSGNSFAGISDTTSWNFSTVAAAEEDDEEEEPEEDTDDDEEVEEEGGLTEPANGFRIRLRNGKKKTSIKNVRLRLYGGPDAVQMKISNFKNFRGAQKIDYKRNKRWNICKGKSECEAGTYTVYAKYYSADGSVSRRVRLRLTFTPPVDADEDEEEVTADTACVELLENDLSLGDSGTEVSSLQELLRDQGHFTFPQSTGLLGSITEQAVKDFQLANGLTVDGIVDEATRDALHEAIDCGWVFTRILDPGASGEEVSRVQILLRSLGYFTFPQITGFFGPVTEAAVNAFQRDYGFFPYPGRVGPFTRGALNNEYTQGCEDVLPMTSDLSIGASGEEVRALQTVLGHEGYFNFGTTTSFFGTVTEAAVRDYQTAHGLVATGVVDATTREMITVDAVSCLAAE